MNVLLVHQNFPAQFRYLAPALAARGDRVVALCMNDSAPLPGVETIRSRPGHTSASDGHPWTRDFDAKVIRGHAVLESARRLAAQGFIPEVIIAHPGWGESLFLKQLWPAARLGVYCEYFHGAPGSDLGFDPEFPEADPLEAACRQQLRNLPARLSFDTADAAMAPTHWQAGTYPETFRRRITVIHDGIDTRRIRPDPDVALQVGTTTLRRGDPVITFAARNLEPYRGYHVFMRALPELLARHPAAQVLVIGGSGTSYGAPPPTGKTWQGVYFAEVSARIDRSRVHFLGQLPQAQFRAALQLSMVHVYLTYPFVLSWSLLEAMAAGCAVVASDTAPVREVISDGETGRLFPFFDGTALVGQIGALLASAGERQRLGAAARQHVVDTYDLESICLPQQLAWVDRLNRPDRST